MVTPKSGATRVAVAISVILHVAAFITLALVKLYINEDVEESGISVTFTHELNTRAMRRSLHVRPAVSLSESAQPRPAGQRVDARPIHGVSSDFYIADTSEEVFA